MCFIVIVSTSPCSSEIINIQTKNQIGTGTQIPIAISICSIKDLRVKEGQKVVIGQVLAPIPLDLEAPQRYISKSPQRDAQKQREKIARLKKIVQEEELPDIIIKHEEAKLADLEFAAKEHALGAIDPKAPKETVYKSPVNGIIRKIIPTNGSDGKLNVEILIEQMG